MCVLHNRALISVSKDRALNNFAWKRNEPTHPTRKVWLSFSRKDVRRNNRLFKSLVIHCNMLSMYKQSIDYNEAAYSHCFTVYFFDYFKYAHTT